MSAPDASIRAVLDTSVLVPTRMRRSLQGAAGNRFYAGIWSPWIIAELNRVLSWRWIKNPPPDRQRGDLLDANERRCSESAKRMMDVLFPIFELVNPVPPYPTPWAGLTDEWDRPILAAAIVGRAQYVVSENTRHFPPRGDDGRHVYQGIEYIRARPFLELVLPAPEQEG